MRPPARATATRPRSWCPLIILGGAAIGLLIGVLVQYFDVQPFIASLAGLFLARGLAFVVSLSSIRVENESVLWLQTTRYRFGEWYITPTGILALLVAAIGAFVMQYTRFGRTIYAVGGNEQSARLMGLNVARTKVLVYVISGVCAGLAGLVLTAYSGAGYPRNGIGTELDVIAAVVIGGTLLTGGTGYVLGSVIGVFVYGTIKTVISFMGAEQSWTRIIVGLMLLLFIGVQRIIVVPLGASKIAACASGDNGRMETRPLLELAGGTVYFGADAALDAVDFRLFPGEVHSLMGENGAGKSTLIKAITGALPLSDGELRLDGVPGALRVTARRPAARDPGRLPGDRPGPEHLGRGEHRARLRAAPVRDDRLGADARATPTPSSPTSGSTSTPPRSWAGTPWPCSSWWPSRGRSSPTSGCWCSTSRRRAWTSTSAPSCSASSATSSSAASRSCSSPTSSTRSTRSATG